jgi:Uma2 family endonuclease
MAAPQQLSRRPFTAEDVHGMVEAGILGEDEPVELLAGELVIVSPQAPPHAALISEIEHLLRRAYADAHVRVQCPLAASADSLPEPDLAVVRGRPRDYLRRHPGGADVVLVVEVAFTSQALDRAKAPIYAAAGVPVYWLLDCLQDRLEVRTEPQAAEGYRVVRLYGPEDEVPLPASGGLVRVAELLP